MPDWQLAGEAPGRQYPSAVPDHLAADYAVRDLDPAAHRRVYVELLGDEAAYERILGPAGWIAYPDARPTLDALRARGRVGLISNIGFDIRPVLDGLGLAFDAVILSCEHGATKPDPILFAAAFAALGTPPEACLMVGDTLADAGAAALGARALILPMTPPGGPHGLDAVLSLSTRT